MGVKWLGAGMVVLGVAVFPAAVWFPGPWGVISLLLVIVGCFVLVASSRGARRSEDAANDQ